ncbi:hypothetical protein ACP3WE_24450, partial [Salmonella enterica]|uniref:hypothetical protein n=1 Tax=Salmonella enterica TaxID=28901 RepID=UPI003CF0F74C
IKSFKLVSTIESNVSTKNQFSPCEIGKDMAKKAFLSVSALRFAETTEIFRSKAGKNAIILQILHNFTNFC